MKNEKIYLGFLIYKIWQILKRFSRAISWAQTSYFWWVHYDLLDVIWDESFYHQNITSNELIAIIRGYTCWSSSRSFLMIGTLVEVVPSDWSGTQIQFFGYPESARSTMKKSSIMPKNEKSRVELAHHKSFFTWHFQTQGVSMGVCPLDLFWFCKSLRIYFLGQNRFSI